MLVWISQNTLKEHMSDKKTSQPPTTPYNFFMIIYNHFKEY
jgi:hypothetical protein